MSHIYAMHIVPVYIPSYMHEHFFACMAIIPSHVFFSFLSSKVSFKSQPQLSPFSPFRFEPIDYDPFTDLSLIHI